MADAPVEFGKQDEGRGCVARRVYQKGASLPLLGGEGNGVYNGGNLGFEWLSLVDLDRDGADIFNRSVSERLDLRLLVGCEGVGEV